MRENFFRCITLIIASGIAAFSQTTSVFVGAGYSAPAAAQVAPGQVVTLFYRGVGPSEDGKPRSGRAEPQLPTSLAGVSAQIIQGTSLWDVPMIEVGQHDTCALGFSGPACGLTSIRVQIPYEVDGNVTRDAQSGSVTLPPIGQLVLYADGHPVAITPLQPLPDNAHVLTTCDVEEQSPAGAPCNRIVFHLDGTAVNADSPAARGETVAVFLYGLGQTSPNAMTGTAAQPGYALTDVLDSPRAKASLTPFVNAVASLPRHGAALEPNEIPATITAGGLEGGKVGVYELSIALPESLPPTVSCGGGVHSNYVLNVTTSQGVEATPVCIAQ